MVTVINNSLAQGTSIREILLEYFRVTKPRVVSLIVLTGFVSLFISAKGIGVGIDDLIFSVLSGYFAVGGLPQFLYRPAPERSFGKSETGGPALCPGRFEPEAAHTPDRRAGQPGRSDE